MGSPQRESFRADARYKQVLWIRGRDAQDWSLNEQEAIQDAERRRLGDAVFKDGAIVAGLATGAPNGAAGTLSVSDGAVYISGRAEPVAGAALAFAPGKASGVDTVYLRWLLDQVDAGVDPTLVAPATGDVVEERLRVQASLTTSTPDAFDEAFERWDPSGAPLNWVVESGAVAKGYPAKFGETALLLRHVNGLETRIRRDLTLAPGAVYTVHFQVRTAPGKADLSLVNGTLMRFSRSSPIWSPPDFVFATGGAYVRKTFTLVADVNAAPVSLFLVIPAVAPTTDVLVDAVLVTASPLGALDLDRHYVPLLFWDRATDAVTRAVTRASAIHMADLEPPLDGRDVINIPLNDEFLAYLGETVFDANGHYRVPPGLAVSRDASLDAGASLGFRVGAGRAYVRGRRVDKPVSTALAVAKALTTRAIANEGHAQQFGLNLIPLNKTLGADTFPVASVREVDAVVEQTVVVTRGAVGGGIDALGVENVTQIMAVSAGAPGSLVGAPGPFAFTEGNNVFKITVPNYDGSAGPEQTIVFARGTYALTEVLDALVQGSGRAYRSGKIVGNVAFSDDGTGRLKIATKTQALGAAVVVGGAASTANATLGFANGQASANGSGTQYAQTTSWLPSGNSIDWSPPGPEPAAGTSYSVVLRRTAVLAAGADYALGGVFASAATFTYKVAAWGPDGEGLPGPAGARLTAVGDINLVSWTAVPNAVSYHLYRSSDGVAFAFLVNTTAVGFHDDGSMTPDAGKAPSAVQTATTGAVAPASASIPVGSTAGFASAGTAFINGTDDFIYTSLTAASFNGVSGVDASYAAGTVVTPGPAAAAAAVSIDNVGVLNLDPRGKVPVDGTTISVSYAYYQPRADRVVLDQFGSVAALAGVAADRPDPPAVPSGVLELAQIRVEPNSARATVSNLKGIDRVPVVDIRRLMDRVETLFRNDAQQQILNEVSTKNTTTKKGLFADGFSSLANADVTHPSFAALVDDVNRVMTVPSAVTRVALSVDAATTTAAPARQDYVLPSAEIVLADQPQWSEEVNVNPFAAFTPPAASLMVSPRTMSWTLKSSVQVWQDAANVAAQSIAMQENRILASLPDGPIPLHGAIAIGSERIERARDIIRQAMALNASASILESVVLTVAGADYASNEDNIAVTFAGLAVTAAPLGGTAAGTAAGTVKADASGRWSASITIPTGVAAGTVDVRGRGPFSDASASFTGFAGVIPPPPPVPPALIDPVGESFTFDADVTVSAIDLFFTAKDASIPVTVQLRTLEAGVPSGHVIASRTLAPSEVSVTGPTKVEFPGYVDIPSGMAFAVTVMTSSNRYRLQAATLGKVGQNPSAIIASNPYPRGVMFVSSNAQSWTVLQGSDLRFRLYGRNFAGSAVLQFAPVQGVDLGGLWLGVDQSVRPGATLSWEYELNGDGIVRPFAPFNRRRLDARASSVILRARLATSSPGASPRVTLPTVGLAGFLSALSGTYVSVQVPFAQSLASAKLYIQAALPSGTAMVVSASNDDGATWTAATLDGTTAINLDFSEFAYSVAFPDATKSLFRVKVNLSATSPLAIPYVAQVGATLA